MISVQEQNTGASLFELAGGPGGLRAIVEELFRRIEKDPLLRDFRAGQDLPGLKRLQIARLSQILNGSARALPQNPPGVRGRHAGRISAHLKAALQALNVPEPVCSRIAEAHAPSSPGAGGAGSRGGLMKRSRPQGMKSRSRPAQAGSELAEMRALMEALKVSHCTFELDLDATIASASDSFAEVLGWKAQDMRGIPFQSLVDPGQRDSAEQRQLWNDARDGSPCEAEIKLQGKSGREVWMRVALAPVPGPDGLPLKIAGLASDTTASRRAAGELAELRVRAEMVDMTSIVSESDLKGDILAVNAKFCEVSQYSREELVGKPHSTTRHPDMPRETFRQLWATIGSGKTFRGVIKNRKKDGSPYYVDAVVAPIPGENGKPRKYIGVRYDITEMELERQNMRGILGAINSAYAYVEFDTQGVVLSANDRFLAALGYRAEEAVGKHHRMFVEPAEAASADYSRFWAELGSGRSQSGIFKRVTKAGRDIHIQAVYAPVKDETGRVLKIVKIATDVTEQKVAEINARRQIEEINRSQATIELDDRAAIVTANENFLRLTGYRLDELKGRPHSILLDPAQRDSAEDRQLWRDLLEGRFQTAEYKRISKGGADIWLQATYNPHFGVDGAVCKVVMTALDITARKRAEASLKTTLSMVAQNAQTLGSAAEELSANSQQMVGNAEETATQANVVSAAAEQVSKNVQTVATGTEELSASIREIAKNAMDAAKVAAVAVRAAETTNATISKLGESSAEIGKVIKVITSIAQQTNLLALNATIEAARAGEAGKGFAVVANEVKELAKETAKATEDISQKIEAIQADTKSAVDAISEIGGVINKINDYQNTIASAVEEQTATTNEISRNVTEAARGSSEIAENITGVASAARNTTSGANDTQRASEELSRMASELQKIVGSSSL